jgi:hypothetical protein
VAVAGVKRAVSRQHLAVSKDSFVLGKVDFQQFVILAES